MISPPPTPKSALKKPATTPMTASRSTARIVWAWTRSPDCVRRRSAPRSCSTSTGRSRRSSRGRRTRPSPRRRAPCSATSSSATRSSPRSPVGRARSDASSSASKACEVVGSHGLELARRRRRMARAAGGVPRHRRLARRGQGPRALVPLPHARRSGAARAELERVAERARNAGLRARFGRMVLEVLPPLDAHKGTAVRALLHARGLTRALFAGDDTTDLDAFARRRASSRSA